MKKILFSLLIIFAFTACVNTDYIGRSYPRTENVEIFFSQSDIERDYIVMGKITEEASEHNSFESLQEAMIRKAKSKGADAVLLDDMEKRSLGRNSTTVGGGGRTKHLGIGTSTTSTREDDNNLLRGVLLKYK